MLKIQVVTKNKSINELILEEVDIILLWYQIPKSEWGDKKKKLKK